MMGTRTFTDMMNRKVSLNFPPRRIISVVPSQTELLHTLGLEDEVCGITKFCVHPQEWFDHKTRVGGTKTLDLDQIIALKPDLIIANKEENKQEQIEALAQQIPVWISDISTVEEAQDMIAAVGEITGRETAADKLNARISDTFRQVVRTQTANTTVAYFIWRQPWMVAGGDTFIHDMLGKAGLQNVYAQQTRYPETSPEELAALNPRLVLLSSEPYPFKEKHIAELQTILPHAKIMLADGELFSWYGSRMQYAAGYLMDLLQKL